MLAVIRIVGVEVTILVTVVVVSPTVTRVAGVGTKIFVAVVALRPPDLFGVLN